MPTYKQLMTRHPACGVEDMGLRRALYEGGKAIKARYRQLLPKRPGEPDARYKLRIDEARYRNYIGPIVDFFVAMLFSTRPIVAAKKEGTDEVVDEPPEFYGQFFDDCDRKGTKVDAVFKKNTIDAMVDGYSWLQVHAPAVETEPESLADFEAQKLGECWIEGLQADEVLDWLEDDAGLVWAIRYEAKQERLDVTASRDTIVETWTVLYRERVDTYRLTRKANEKPDKEAEVPLVKSEKHRFGKVPLVCVEMPTSMHVAARLEDPQLSHFRMSCAQSWSLATCCYAMPVFSLKDQDSVPKMGAGVGLVIGAEESVAYLAPPSDHFSSLADEIESEKDEIFRIAHQMALGVENNAAAVGRSGESKQQDAQATRVAMLALSRICKEAIENVYDLIGDFRGDKLDWQIAGLDDFAAVDLQGLLDSLKKINEAGGIPSETFNTEIKSRTAEAFLPDISQPLKSTIRKEIAEGVKKAGEEESELSQMTKDLKAQEVKNAKSGIVPPNPGGFPTAKNPTKKPKPGLSPPA